MLQDSVEVAYNFCTCSLTVLDVDSEKLRNKKCQDILNDLEG